jgi:cytidylate kinase
MNKKNIISISGELASGKGTVSKLIAEELDYKIYRNGEYARTLAKSMGLDITSFNEYLGKHPEIDRQIEKSAAEYAASNDNFVIDARLGWYAVPESFKVYLTIDIDIAAKRALNDLKRKETECFTDLESQKADLIRRYTMENERYFNLYGIHKEDKNNYDLVIDTSDKTPEQVKNEILKQYKLWQKS